MHEYYKIKQRVQEILIPLGFEEIKPDTDLDVDGSVHCIFAKSNFRFMIEWNGEDRCGYINSWQNSQWQQLGSTIFHESETELYWIIESTCKELQKNIKDRCFTTEISGNVIEGM
jgi:hypothetical protein